MRPAASDQRIPLTIFLAGFFVVLLVRTAWLSDDAYITFRTVDNFVSGYGLRWNVAERVQSFTHPLWLFVVSIPYYFTREVYFTSILLTMACSIAAFALLVGRAARSASTALIVGVTLLFSKSFVDYSTSGLENPLTHLLIVLMLFASWDVQEDGRGLTRLWVLGGLVTFNRLDLALLVIPLLIASSWPFGLKRALRSASTGFAPVLCWEFFSAIYYGALFPNTAYAKLHVGIPAGQLAEQGILYLLDAFSTDPVTPLMIVSGTTMLAVADLRRHWPIVLGILFYAAYIVRVGGDFMAGRFLTAPLVLSLGVWSREEWSLARQLLPFVVATEVILGTVATTRPPVTSGSATFVPEASRDGMSMSGVADERAYYYRYTGLLRYSRERPLPWNSAVERGMRLRGEGLAVVTEWNIGFVGYYAGPAVTIIDEFGLADPFLARLPTDPDWRIGHYHRTLPKGYLETIKTGRNQIADTQLAMLYERVRNVTQDPLWSRKRWRAILALSLQ